MVGHGGSSAGSYLADPTSPIPSHCASIVATSTLRVKFFCIQDNLAIRNVCSGDTVQDNAANKDFEGNPKKYEYAIKLKNCRYYEVIWVR